MTSESMRQMVRIFTPGLLSQSAALGGDALTAFQRSRVRESMGVDLRKLCDVVVPAIRRPQLSAAAMARAAELGIDLLSRSWQSQKSFDPGRSTFHYEHITPVGAIVAKILDANGPVEIEDLVCQELRVAWVLKSEDRRLAALGYRTKRPDPVTAYAEAGIVLMPPVADDEVPPRGVPPTDEDTSSAPFDSGPRACAEGRVRHRMAWQPHDITVHDPEGTQV